MVSLFFGSKTTAADDDERGSCVQRRCYSSRRYHIGRWQSRQLYAQAPDGCSSSSLRNRNPAVISQFEAHNLLTRDRHEACGARAGLSRTAHRRKIPLVGVSRRVAWWASAQTKDANIEIWRSLGQPCNKTRRRMRADESERGECYHSASIWQDTRSRAKCSKQTIIV